MTATAQFVPGGKMAAVTRGPRQGSTRPCCPLIKSQLYMCTGRFVVTQGAGERWSSGTQDATLPYTVWPSATKTGTSLTILSLSPFAPPHSWQSRRNHMAKADSTLRTVRAVPHPNKQLGQRWKETRCIRHGMPVSDQGWYRPVIPSRWSLAPQHLAKLP